MEDLAVASWEEVLEQWRGLGYYRRARNLQKAAQVVVQEYGGKFPETYEELKKLPGVGSYTAAAIAGFAYGEKIPALDTNISRVFARIFGETWNALKPGERFGFAKRYIGVLSSRDFNYGLMDVGAMVCHARQPKCGECCFRGICAYKISGQAVIAKTMNEKTYTAPIGSQPRLQKGLALADKVPAAIKVAAGVLIHNGKVLISKRPKGKPMAGLWEFPGGKIEFGENERTCLKREFIEELGVEVSVRPHFYKTLTEHEGVQILLSFHSCRLLLGNARAREGQEFKWVDAEQLQKYKFPEANTEVVEILQQKKAMFSA